MTTAQMKDLANKPGMPVTTDPRAIAARSLIEALHSGNKADQESAGKALNKSVKKFGKP